MTDVPAPDDLAKAFVFGYPLVYDLDEVDDYVHGGDRFPQTGPYNELVHARTLLGPETKFVSPNNDTLYTLVMCDVRDTDLLLDVPDTAGRYYVLQFVDAWTNNFAYLGRRSTGTGAGSYLLTTDPGAQVDGRTTIVAPTGVFSIVGRVQVDGESDLPAVHAVQDGFRLTPVDGDATPAGIAPPNPDVPADLVWWEKFRSRLAEFPPGPSDAEALAACEAAGLTGGPDTFVDVSSELHDALIAGEQAGRDLIESLLSGGGTLVNGWASGAHMFDYDLDHLGLGTRDDPAWKIADPATRYATRAYAARAGLWGNHGYEAVYLIVAVDGEGRQLNGGHRYRLRLPSAPPVNAFWSLTMYDTPEYHLVDNPLGRYSIGSATSGLATADDGSITILLQHESPGADQEANWLPAPPGDFRPILRLYDPQAPALDGTYEVPAIERLD